MQHRGNDVVVAGAARGEGSELAFVGDRRGHGDIRADRSPPRKEVVEDPGVAGLDLLLGRGGHSSRHRSEVRRMCSACHRAARPRRRRSTSTFHSTSLMIAECAEHTSITPISSQAARRAPSMTSRSDRVDRAHRPWLALERDSFHHRTPHPLSFTEWPGCAPLGARGRQSLHADRSRPRIVHRLDLLAARGSTPFTSPARRAASPKSSRPRFRPRQRERRHDSHKLKYSLVGTPSRARSRGARRRPGAGEQGRDTASPLTPSSKAWPR